MAPSIRTIALSALAFASTALSQTDLSSVAGPFQLVTVSSLTTPVVPTSYLELYYYTWTGTSGGLALFSTPDSVVSGETFRLVDGVLGTYYRPDDVPGSDPWNATTPSSNTYPLFTEQYAAHAGFDFVDGTFLAIHGVTDVWSLCTDSYDNQVLTYEASGSRSGCTSTYVALYVSS